MNTTTGAYPWSDCKVAFDIDDDEKFWDARDDGRLALPEGWEFDGTDGAGARSVAIFRVDGLPTLESGVAVLASLKAIGAVP